MTEQTIDLERLTQFIPFDCLSESHVRDICGQIQVINLPPARVLFKRSDRTDLAYFLIKGSVDLTDASFQVRKFPADADENYLALDNVMCVGGTWLTPADLVSAKDWAGIATLAKQACISARPVSK